MSHFCTTLVSYEGLISKSLELLAECYLSKGCDLYHKDSNKVLGGINKWLRLQYNATD